VNTFQFQAGQRIEIVQADSDVGITGWDRETVELTLDGDLDQCTVQHAEGRLILESHAAMALRVPWHLDLHVGETSGDLILHQIQGNVTIESVHGDLSVHAGTGEVAVDRAQGSLTIDGLTGTFSIERADGDVHVRSSAGVHLGTVHGALYAHDIEGPLEIGVVDGAIRAQEVAGRISLEKGKSSFHGQDLHGGIDLDEVDGDLFLHTEVTPGLAYRARAKGTVQARFPAETSARFQLRAGGHLSAKLPQVERQEPNHVIGSAGAGDAEIDLQTDSHLTVYLEETETNHLDIWTTADSLSSRIEAEIEQHLGEMNVDALAQREIDKVMRKAEQELAKAQQRLEQEQLRAQEAAQRAQERITRVQERAARAARRAQEKIARKSHRWAASAKISPSLFGPTVSPEPPQDAGAGASREEQLAILEMLQQNKITVAEAEELLAALGS
jgi:hypothetical protein